MDGAVLADSRRAAVVDIALLAITIALFLELL
jgi:hypothetical protein